jgi:Domain of unknown function DUF29
MTLEIIAYEKDVVLWSQQQAAHLRAGQWSQLDIEHLADEIEDVGRSEKRELASRTAVLIAHLLKWHLQPARRGAIWEATIKLQRKLVDKELKSTPSLKATLKDEDWQSDTWLSSVQLAAKETGLDMHLIPQEPLWSFENLLNPEFWPN